MRTLFLPFCVAATMLLAFGLPLDADGQTDSIKIELKKFKPRVKEGTSALNTYDENNEKLNFFTPGWFEATVKIPADGEYEITIKASCDPALNERAKFKLTIDDKLVGKETLLTDDGEKEYKLSAPLKAGDRKLGIEFTNDVYKEGEYDRNLFVYGVKLKKLK